MKKVLYWMNHTINLANNLNTNDLKVTAALVDNNELVCDTGKEVFNPSKILNTLKEKNIKKIDYLFITINKYAKNFELNKILDKIKINKIYIGLPDPTIHSYLKNDPILNNDNIYRYPDNFKKKIYNQNIDYYLNSKQNIKNCSYYSSKRISSLISSKLKEYSWEISSSQVRKQKSLKKLSLYISQKYHTNQEESLAIINNILEESYDEKYSSYNYSYDIRSINPKWNQNFEKVYSNVSNIPINQNKIINIGVGSGNEAKILFSQVSNITFADIAPNGLNIIKNAFPHSKTIKCKAEEISNYVENNYDLYVSLRTYNSSFFNTNMAINEAYKILKNNGIFIISIANGFLNDLNKEIIPGLIIPQLNYVDLYRGLDEVKLICKELKKNKFININITPTDEEIFISARKDD